MSKLSDIGRAHRPQQRKHRRFELRYPVNVKFAQGNSVSEMRAVSNDISVGGLLLEAESRIPQHCDVSFTVMVKGHHVVGPTKIVGEGQVVRVEPHRSGAGFAIALRCERPISKLEDYFRGSVI
jgi:PilZ domain